MALKKKLTKEEHEKLPDVLKAEYVEDGDGYRLDVTGEEDAGELRRAKDREKQLRKDAEKKLEEAQAQLDALGTDDARKKGDIATLEKSWQGKMDTQKKESDERIAKLTSHTTKSLVDNVALTIATKISKSPALMLPHIKARLQADFDGDEPKTRVLDKDGKASALTIEELSNEFVANTDFADIIIASKASGGAGKSSQNGGGAPNKFGSDTGNDKPVDLSKLGPQELAARITAKKAEQQAT